MTDFDKIPAWADVAAKDAYRRWLQFFTIERLLGDVAGKRILDVGCGTGLFPMRIAGKGARVIGFDRSARNIAEADKAASATAHDIKYFHATQVEFLERLPEVGPFDAATSNMVLQYAESLQDLTDFFGCAGRYLRPGGRFISVVFNPSFSEFGRDIGPRRFTKLAGNLVRVDFLDEPSGQTHAHSHQYTRHEYEDAVMAGGMRLESWQELSVDPEGPTTLGAGFWVPVRTFEPFRVLICQSR